MSVGRRELHWEGAALKKGGKEVARIDPEDHYGFIVWRIHFPDGTSSKDVYNKDRAKENAMSEVINKFNATTEAHTRPADALK